MKNYHEDFEEDNFYHIYNRGNNHEKIFFLPKNYTYFLKKYREYLSEYVETYAYCLLPNHFHFLVKINNAEEMPSFKKMASLPLSDVISTQFRRFFIGYSMAINKQENRTGSLSQKNFKRIRISSEEYIMNLMFYIHANPQRHKIINDFKIYPWSSYQPLLQNNSKVLKCKVCSDWFGGKQYFTDFHKDKINLRKIEEFTIE